MELKIKCVNTTTSSDGSQYGKFVIEPLEKGFGTTIGNSLRRVLLSSLEGTAVTAARIEGITHEYTAIPGVLEDVIDVMLNLKGLVVFVLLLTAEVSTQILPWKPVKVTLHTMYREILKEFQLMYSR